MYKKENSYPHQTNVFGGFLESARLSAHPCTLRSVSVQNTVANYSYSFAAIVNRRLVDTLIDTVHDAGFQPFTPYGSRVISP